MRVRTIIIINRKGRKLIQYDEVNGNNNTIIWVEVELHAATLCTMQAWTHYAKPHDTTSLSPSQYPILKYNPWYNFSIATEIDHPQQETRWFSLGF